MRKRGFEVISEFKDHKVTLPSRATTASAGYDIEACEEVIIEPGESVLVKTGLKAYMQNNEVLKLYIRSSLASKRQLVLTNSVGIIDADYYNNERNEGHILIALMNHSNETQVVKKGERIAQGIFEQYLLVDDDQVIATKRLGGFGSSNN